MKKRPRIPREPDLAEYVPAFLADLGRMICLAREALESGRCADLDEIGHKLKGTGGTFGFDRVSELGRELQASSAKEGFGGAAATLAELDSIHKKGFKDYGKR